MGINDARDLLVYELSGLHNLERSIQNELPTKISECTTEECRTLFRHDQQVVPQQIRNLEQCFQILGTQPMSVTSHVVEGMRADKQNFLQQQPSPELVEVYNLDATAKQEHLEVASYRALAETADQLGETDCARLLRENLRMQEEEVREVEQAIRTVGSRIVSRGGGPSARF